MHLDCSAGTTVDSNWPTRPGNDAKVCINAMLLLMYSSNSETLAMGVFHKTLDEEEEEVVAEEEGVDDNANNVFWGEMAEDSFLVMLLGVVSEFK